MTDPAPDRTYRRLLVLAMCVGVSAAFIVVVSDYLMALFVAAIFSSLLHPIYRRILVRCGGRNWLASTIILFGFVLAVGVPLVFVFGLVAGEAVAFSRVAVSWISKELSGPIGSADLPEWLPFSEALEPYRAMLLEKIEGTASDIGSSLFAGLTSATSSTIQFGVSLFVFLYAMPFFLMRGEGLFHAGLRYLPLGEADRDKVVAKGISVTRATLKSIVVIGLLQGLLLGMAFWIVGLPGAALWGGVVVVLAAVPVLGPPMIWVPACIWLVINDQWSEGIGLAAWGTLVIGLVDNILRPMLVGRETKLPDLVVLVSSLGGIGAFGAIGILVGPIIAAVFFVMLDIFRHTFVATRGSDNPV